MNDNTSQGSAYAFADQRVVSVELTCFEVRGDSSRAAVRSWRTLTETNNRGFTVEHRVEHRRAAVGERYVLREDLLMAE